MPCSVVKFPGGSAIVCRPKDRPRKCSVCGTKTPNVKLCDFEVRPAFEPATPDGLTTTIGPKTCDAVLCQRCAVHQDPDTDYCPVHAAAKGIGGRRLRL